MAANESDAAPKPVKKRLFVNQVDTYNGKNMAEYLSYCVVGASMEEAEEEEAEEKSESEMIIKDKEGCYEIIGTLKNTGAEKPDFVKEIITYETRNQLYEILVECDIIVYDITQDFDEIDEAIWVASELHADLEKFIKGKIFILISSVLTWAKSKPLDPDDPEISFTEDDYRRRKPHPNFKEHISAEKTIIKLGKTSRKKLSTYVVAAGLTYGTEENLFHYLFKAGWHNKPYLECFGNGQNIIPTIHIKDLAAVIQNLSDGKPKVRYLIAKDDSSNTLEEIVKAVSSNLTTGKVQTIIKDEALLDTSLQQSDFDMLLVDLRMDAIYIKESMRINWVAESGIVEHIVQLVKEYKESRKLMPIRVCILGPPAVGKSTIVQQLCKAYKLHHLQIQTIINEYIQKLTDLQKQGNEETEEEEEDDETGRAEEAEAILEEINESKVQNNGRIEDKLIVQMYKEKLRSMPCLNQGFILDGYPKTTDQARMLFEADEEEEEEAADKGGAFEKMIMPEYIISLESTDEFLTNRVMNLPHSTVSGTHNTEEGLLRRLTEFRTLNTDDETVLNYFDELEIHPNKIDISKDNSPMMHDTVEAIKRIIGEARNYGPTSEELRKIQEEKEQKYLKEEEEARLKKEKEEEEEAMERQKKEADWAEKLNEIKNEEHEFLEAQSIPLRNYLMKHVMPTITLGLIDCCKVRPEDPVDYLAEYLFKNNPQID